MAAVKKEQDSKQALVEAQQAVLEKTTPISSATQKPNKRAKSAGKKKWRPLALTSSLSSLGRHLSTSLCWRICI